MTQGIQQLIWQIERCRDAFHHAVHTTRDVDAALATVHHEVELTNTPAGTGARGTDALRRYLAEDVLPHLPADLTFTRVSRTVDQRHIVDEMTVGFTHDRDMPWLLPGVAPTGLHVETTAISVVSVRHTSRLGRTESRIVTHRTLWDQTALSGSGAASTPRSYASSPGPRRP